MNKAEQFVNKHFGVPSNWDKHDKDLPRYTLTDIEDAVEQFADKQLTEYRDKLLEALYFEHEITRDDIIDLCASTSHNNNGLDNGRNNS